MKNSVVSTQLSLERGETWHKKIKRRHNLKIRCIEGTTWLTTGQGERDVILKSGEAVELAGPCLTVIQGIDEAKLITQTR